MKKNLKKNIIVTSAMVGAVIAAPAIVGVVDDTGGLNLDGKLGLDKITNEALAFAGGDGTAESPFLIATSAELQSITDLTAHYKLTSDINLVGVKWMPLGDSVQNAFSGSFDGDGFTIKNMRIADNANEHLGFVGYLGDKGVIKNVTFENARVTISLNHGKIAVVAGYSQNGVIDNVHVRKSSVDVGSSSAHVALGVGVSDAGMIKNSSFEGKIESVGSVGTIAGMGMGKIAETTIVENVSTQGSINLDKSRAIGGLVGYKKGWTDIEVLKNIVTNVDIVGKGDIGGLIGWTESTPIFENIVIYGSIQSTSAEKDGFEVGGLIGSGSKAAFDEAETLLKNVYLYMRETEGLLNKPSAYGFVSYGVVDLKSRPSTSNVRNAFVQSYENMGGNLGNTGVQESLTLEEMVDVLKYEPYGMDFKTHWMMSETGPVLKIMPMTPILNDSAVFAGGDGSIYNPYVIETAEQFQLIGKYLNSNFVLGADIDLSGVKYTPIGSSAFPFRGTLDGKGWTISNVTIKDSLRHTGLFGVMEQAKIKNLNLDGFDISTSYSTTNIAYKYAGIGALFGEATNSKIENIRVENSVVMSKAGSGAEITAGGLGGKVMTNGGTEHNDRQTALDGIRVDNTTVTNADPKMGTGGVIGLSEANQKAGVLSNVIMNDIYANVSVQGFNGVGGIAGLIRGTSILNAVSKGSVNGTQNVGGIVGYSQLTNHKALDLIENVISYSSVNAKTTNSKFYAGGIAGYLESLTLKNAYAFNTEIRGHQSSAKKVYGGKRSDVILENVNASPNITTTLLDGEGVKIMDVGAMTSRATYDGLFDFNNHWTISEGNQPSLLIEHQIAKGSGASNNDEEIAYQLIEKVKSIPFKFDQNQYESALEEYYEIEDSKYGTLVKSYVEELMHLYQVKINIDNAVSAAESNVSTPQARTLFNVAQNKIESDGGEFDLTAYEKFEKNTYHQIRVNEFGESAIADATAKVVIAEKSLLEKDVEIAQIAVDLIPDGNPAKQGLQDRIDAIKELAFLNENLAKAIEKVDQTMLQEDLAKAEDLFKKVKISADIAKFTPLMTAIRNLVAANETVKSAEADKTAEKVLAAKTAIGKVMVDHIQYDGLMHRVNVVDADIAVTLAESSKLEENIQSAQTKVTALKESPEKTALQVRLDKLNALIEAEKAFDEATKAVEDAEKSKSEEDINNAQDKIDALPDGKEKNDLQDRLDKVKDDLENEKALEDAKDAVDQAETSKDEADIKDAQDKIDALPDGKDKDDLQDRLDNVKDEVGNSNALAEATKAVEKAESTKKQIDIDLAQTKVTALPASVEKDALQARLDALNAELEGSNPLEDAKDAVDKAESSKDEADIKDAQDKIDALPDGKDKDDLQDRLDKVKDEVGNSDALAEATKAVEKAESTKTKTDIDAAQTKVAALPDSPEKEALQARLDALKAEVEQDVLFQTLVAEVKEINKGILDGKIRVDGFTKARADLESIRKRGEALKDADQKTQLNDLIDATLALMDLVEKIEGGDKNLDDISKLPDSEIKDEYLDEIASSDALAAAEKAVAQAEKTITLADIDAADQLVSKLAPSDAKRDLNERLDVVKEKYKEAQAILKATELVEIAEESLRSSDIARAENAVNSLKDGAEKAALEARIEAIYKKIEEKAYDVALKAVEKAEELRTNNSIAYAKDKVATLRDSAEKTALEKRIEALEREIYMQAEMDRLYKQALEAVEKAERSTIIAYLTTAIKLTNKVSDVDERKAGLEERIKAIQLRNLIASTEAELKRLEQRPSQTMVKKVEEMIDILPDTVDEKEGFIARLNAVKQLLDNDNYAKALKAVVFAENIKIENKRAAYYNALPLVDVVFDSARKTILEERLIAILKEVEAYERMDGDYIAGGDIVKAAESIKDLTAKKYLLAWAKAIVNAEVYYGGTLSKALSKEKASVPANVLENQKYADLINELKERTLHIEQSEKVFGKPGQSAVKKAYEAVLKFEKDRSELNRNDAIRWVEDLSKFKNSSLQIEKFMERINRIEVVTVKK